MATTEATIPDMAWAVIWFGADRRRDDATNAPPPFRGDGRAHIVDMRIPQRGQRGYHTREEALAAADALSEHRERTTRASQLAQNPHQAPQHSALTRECAASLLRARATMLEDRARAQSARRDASWNDDCGWDAIAEDESDAARAAARAEIIESYVPGMPWMSYDESVRRIQDISGRIEAARNT